MQNLQNLGNAVLWETYGDHPSTYYRAKILAIVTLSTSIICFSLGLLFAFALNSWIYSDIVLLVMPILFGTGAILALSFTALLLGYFLIARKVAAASITTSVCLSVVLTGGFPNSQFVPVLILLPLFYYFLYGPRAGLAVSVCTPVFVLAEWTLRNYGNVSLPVFETAVNRHLSLIVILSMIYSIAVLIIATYENANRKLAAMLEAEWAKQSHLASVDSLTGLWNSRHFDDRLRQLDGKQDGQPFAILYCDLDHFKPINDQYGHIVGDQVLAVVGKRLSRLAQPLNAVVARLGGDEFAVLLTGCSEADLEIVADQIRMALSEPIDIDDLTLSIGVSVGWAFARSPDEDPNVVVRRADKAMYSDKRRLSEKR